MGNKDSKKFEKNGYKMIDYPLKENGKYIDYDVKNCTNYRKANHDNIDIIYCEKSDDIPTIYRCPICLCIPIVYYHDSNILYRCNCGFYKCSIDYFFTNFNSFPISKVTFKNSSENNNEIAFCSTCSKFIEPNKHKNEYFGHSIRVLNDIYFKSESGVNYGEFIYKIDENKIDYINSHLNDKENEVMMCGVIIKYSNFIKDFLYFDINELIENSYKKFNKKFSENNISTNNKQIKDLNMKLYIFSKYLYYVFYKNYKEKNLCFEILLNLVYICLQIYKPELYSKKNKDRKNFDVNKTFFLDDIGTLFYKLKDYDNFSVPEEIRHNLNSHHPSNYFKDIFYDIYSKRYVIISDSSIYISLKKDISTIFINLRNLYFAKQIYLPSLNKNILVFKSMYDIIFTDIEEIKIINRISLDKSIFEEDNLKNIEFIENEFLILKKKIFNL